MIHTRHVVKEFSDVFINTELLRECVVSCQMAMAKNDQPTVERRYADMKEIFARLSKEMRELDVQIRRHS